MNKIFKKILKVLRNFILGDYRSKRLGNLIADKILKFSSSKQKIKVLDYGSGFQPRVIFYILKKLKKNFTGKINIDCYDFYKKDEILKLNNSFTSEINFYNLNSLPNETKYDYCLINDVLHHMNIENESLIEDTLKKLLGVAKIVIIKDHFQYGVMSNMIIRFMDFLGNYFNDVKIPKKYYDQKTFDDLINKINAIVIEANISIKLYPPFLIFMSNPDYHFVYLIKNSKI